MDNGELGVLLGVLIASGHFGGDGKQPQLTLKMHVRHEALLRWLTERVPDARLYGPYRHSGRHFFQMMVRGEGLSKLAQLVAPMGWEAIDPESHGRFMAMLERYAVSRGSFT